MPSLNAAANVVRRYKIYRKAEMDRNGESHDFVNGICCRCNAVAGSEYSRLNDCRTIFGLVHCGELTMSKFKRSSRRFLIRAIKGLK